MTAPTPSIGRLPQRSVSQPEITEKAYIPNVWLEKTNEILANECSCPRM